MSKSPKSKSPKVQRSKGPKNPWSKGPKDQDISKSNSTTSLTLKKVHLVISINISNLWSNVWSCVSPKHVSVQNLYFGQFVFCLDIVLLWLRSHVCLQVCVWYPKHNVNNMFWNIIHCLLIHVTSSPTAHVSIFFIYIKNDFSLNPMKLLSND